MVGFGFGLGPGDILGLYYFATRMWEKCRDGPSEYQYLALNVKRLAGAFYDLSHIELDVELEPHKMQQLVEHCTACKELLDKMDKILSKYGNSKAPTYGIFEAHNQPSMTTWQRLRYDPDEARKMTEQLTNNIAFLSHFYLSIMQRDMKDEFGKMRKMLLDMQSGRRDSSTVLSLADTQNRQAEHTAWPEFASQLQDYGMSDAVVRDKQNVIINYFAAAVNAGHFEQNASTVAVPPLPDSSQRPFSARYGEGGGRTQFYLPPAVPGLPPTNPFRQNGAPQFLQPNFNAPTPPPRSITPQPGLNPSLQTQQSSLRRRAKSAEAMRRQPAPVEPNFAAGVEGIPLRHFSTAPGGAHVEWSRFYPEFAGMWQRAHWEGLRNSLSYLLDESGAMDEVQTLRLLLLRGIVSTFGGNDMRAEADFARLLQVSLALDDPLFSISTATWLGDCSLRLGKPLEAGIAWATAVELMESSRSLFLLPNDVLDLYLALSNVRATLVSFQNVTEGLPGTDWYEVRARSPWLLHCFGGKGSCLDRIARVISKIPLTPFPKSEPRELEKDALPDKLLEFRNALGVRSWLWSENALSGWWLRRDPFFQIEGSLQMMHLNEAAKLAAHGMRPSHVSLLNFSRADYTLHCEWPVFHDRARRLFPEFKIQYQELDGLLLCLKKTAAKAGTVFPVADELFHVSICKLPLRSALEFRVADHVYLTRSYVVEQSGQRELVDVASRDDAVSKIKAVLAKIELDAA